MWTASTRGDLRPHQRRHWLVSKGKLEDPAAYEAGVRTVSDTCADAVWIPAEGGHVVSTDGKRRTQATERSRTDARLRPGLTERLAFDYRRHGTPRSNADFDAVSGKVVTPTVRSTRTEEDFALHIVPTTDAAPHATWVLVVDQLDTHPFNSLARLAAVRCGLAEDRGVKGEAGFIESMPSREVFLENTEHRIRFVYPPRPDSGLNQAEIGFSILSQRALERASFPSLEALRRRPAELITHSTVVLAQPFRWTYTGQPLMSRDGARCGPRKATTEGTEDTEGSVDVDQDPPPFGE